MGASLTEQAHEQTPAKERSWDSAYDSPKESVLLSFSKLHLGQAGELRGEWKHRKTNEYQARQATASSPNGAPPIHIYVERAKWAIKETNSLREVFGSLFMCIPPPHGHNRA